MGEYLRRYWVPALLSEEVPVPDCPPARVRILGESLVAFRGHRRPRWPVGQFLPSPSRQPLLRPKRGMRAPLRLPRLEVRRERRLRRHAIRARREQLQGQGAHHRLPLRGARRRCLGLHGPARPQAGVAQPRVGGLPRQQPIPFQVPAGLQLAPGAGGRHRLQPHQLPPQQPQAGRLRPQRVQPGAAERRPARPVAALLLGSRPSMGWSSARAAPPRTVATTGASPRGCSPTPPSSRPRPTPS